MTKMDRPRAYKMRMDGEKLQAIADRFGVSREYIRQITPGAGPRQRRDAYIFPNLAKWLVENGVYNCEFAEMLHSNPTSVSNWLTGKAEPRLGFIKDILRVTGLTFEEAFMRKGERHDTD